jgi:hypothetical protein
MKPSKNVMARKNGHHKLYDGHWNSLASSLSHARSAISNWGSRDLRAGPIARMLPDLGISSEEFEQAEDIPNADQL